MRSHARSGARIHYDDTMCAAQREWSAAIDAYYHALMHGPAAEYPQIKAAHRQARQLYRDTKRDAFRALAVWHGRLNRPEER